MNTVIRSTVFDAWLKGLRDFKGRARIIARVEAAQWGNFGCAVYLLLIGGDKSTQKRDIGVAIAMARELEE